jgi:predicted RNA-binding Zn-ribbon protein involved in translation (DUF1610 family)
VSEYDAGTLPPHCPKCGEWEPVRWDDCRCLLQRAGLIEACATCDGGGGWFTCTKCGFTDKPAQEGTS